MKIKVKESKKQEAAGFDYSMVAEDAKKFDFGTLLDSLKEFDDWFGTLQERCDGKAPVPTLRRGAWGASGYRYYLQSPDDGPITFDLQCDTHGYFEGRIYAGSQKFIINDIDDLHYGLATELADILDKASKNEDRAGRGLDRYGHKLPRHTLSEIPREEPGAGAEVSSVGGFKAVKIGDTWMAENLAIDDGGEGIYHHNGQVYYTWDAAMRVTEGLKGWHLPTRSEVETLFTLVGGRSVASKALRSTSGWRDGGNGTDAFGFSALPAGYRDDEERYRYEGLNASFWCSTEDDRGQAYYMDLYSSSQAYLNYCLKNYAFSVRCIKD